MIESERQIQLEVLRYNPETDSEPRFQTYTVPCLNEWVVLDALNYVKDNLDPTVAYRWSCHMAVCGSCGMMINGEPKLACKAFIREYTDEIRVEPLAHFPIERDLVTVDRRLHGEADARQALPDPEASRGRRQRRRIQADAGTARTLQAVRAVHQLHAVLRRLPGVRPRAEVHRPRGHCPGASLQPGFPRRRPGQRQEVIAAHEGVWECTFVGACSDVCPKHVDPASALQQVKVASTVDWYTNTLCHG